MEFISNTWKNRYTYAQYVAIIASVLNVLGLLLAYKVGQNSEFLSNMGLLMWGFGMLLSLVSYCLGGLWTAIKAALGIAKWGWLVVPFPYDIATGAAAFMFALIVLIFVPIIPVRKAMKEHMEKEYIKSHVRG